MRKHLREPVNGLMHASAALAALPGTAALLLLSGSEGPWLALLIYGLTLVLLFASSASYHLVNGPAIPYLRKLDHSAIYLLIAGSYTPIAVAFLDGFWRSGLLVLIWGLAVIGIAAKLIIITAPRWLTAGIYLLMGWLSLLVIGQLLAAMPAMAIGLLFGGGLLFSFGATCYILKWPDPFPGVFGFHEIWHIFVVLGALCHYLLMLFFIAAG